MIGCVVLGSLALWFGVYTLGGWPAVVTLLFVSCAAGLVLVLLEALASRPRDRRTAYRRWREWHG